MSFDVEASLNSALHKKGNEEKLGMVVDGSWWPSLIATVSSYRVYIDSVSTVYRVCIEAVSKQ